MQQTATVSAAWLIILHLYSQFHHCTGLLLHSCSFCQQWSSHPCCVRAAGSTSRAAVVARGRQAGIDVCSSSSNNDDNTNVSSSSIRAASQATTSVPTRAAIAFGNSSWSRDAEQQQTVSAAWLIIWHLYSQFHHCTGLLLHSCSFCQQWSCPLLCPCSWQHQQSRCCCKGRPGQASMSAGQPAAIMMTTPTSAVAASAAGQATTCSPNKSSHCLQHQQLEQSATAATVSAPWLIISHLYSQFHHCTGLLLHSCSSASSGVPTPCCVRAAGSTSRAAVVAREGQAGIDVCSSSSNHDDNSNAAAVRQQQQGRQQPQTQQKQPQPSASAAGDRCNSSNSVSSLADHIAPVQPVPSLYWAPAAQLQLLPAVELPAPAVSVQLAAPAGPLLLQGKARQASMSAAAAAIMMTTPGHQQQQQQQRRQQHSVPTRAAIRLRQQQLEQNATAATVSAAWLIISAPVQPVPSLYWAPAAQLQLLPAVESPPPAVSVQLAAPAEPLLLQGKARQALMSAAAAAAGQQQRGRSNGWSSSIGSEAGNSCSCRQKQPQPSASAAGAECNSSNSISSLAYHTGTCTASSITVLGSCCTAAASASSGVATPCCVRTAGSTSRASCCCKGRPGRHRCLQQQQQQDSSSEDEAMAGAAASVARQATAAAATGEATAFSISSWSRMQQQQQYQQPGLSVLHLYSQFHHCTGLLLHSCSFCQQWSCHPLLCLCSWQHQQSRCCCKGRPGHALMSAAAAAAAAAAGQQQ